MAVKYFKQEVADLRNEGQTNAYYRVQLNGTITWDSFAKHVASHYGGVSFGDIVKVMQAVTDCLGEKLADGMAVNIEGLGRFKPVIGLKEGISASDIEGTSKKHNAQSLEVKKIAFTAERRLITKVDAKCRLEKGVDSPLRNSQYTLEERLKLAQNFLNEHEFMRVKDYEEMTGLSHSGASSELREFLKAPDSGISSIGKRATLLYKKA